MEKIDIDDLRYKKLVDMSKEELIMVNDYINRVLLQNSKGKKIDKQDAEVENIVNDHDDIKKR